MQSPSTSPLTRAVINILFALADGEKHGFAILFQVEMNTKGKMKMGPGTLYGSIRRMLQAGLIEQSDDRLDPHLDDQRRRFYQLTGLGQRTLTTGGAQFAPQLTVAHITDFLEHAFVGGGS